ncbi:PP2C family serine/threonine-protein phosphatase [Oceanicoccus sp. KOV_DT_Chl]|uniref:PP2C family protein-serine/threonine phosphatase n=1 Tax=Oceanicoccus sp. KOV_DT_Chl TaxID=1904639 RepID=UPI000C7A5646|nr:protein phosphatase 2C domain-containing protein [Oceanicoccus sp. KOV_DT_Chl]
MTFIQFDAKTHPGRVRDHNEDNIFGSADSHLWIVADGMGGHACGEVASEIVVKRLRSSYNEGESLASAIESAHQAVTIEAGLNAKAKGMGATVVAMSTTGNQYNIAWVGDSRAYRLRDNQLELLTRDHSYLEWLKDNGITVEEARKHPKRNVITQSIGVGEPNPDSIKGDARSGDRYLLCSDGLNDELTDEEICTLLRSPDNSETVTQRLINEALEKGGRDNISVIVVDIDPQSRKAASPLQGLQQSLSTEQAKKTWLPIVGGIVAAVVFALVLVLVR